MRFISALTLILFAMCPAFAQEDPVQPNIMHHSVAETVAEYEDPDAECLGFEVKGEALAQILVPGREFRLMSGSAEVGAKLLVPVNTPVEYFPLEYRESTGDDRTTTILIDRSANQNGFNSLLIDFSGSDYVIDVSIEYSHDGLDYSHDSQTCQLFQYVSPQGVARQCEVELSNPSAPFMRLTFEVTDNISLNGLGGGRSQQTVQTYQQLAALAPMRDGGLDGEHVWPVILQSDHLPIRSFVIGAKPQGVSRAIRIARLDANLQPAVTVSGDIYVNGVEVNGGIINNRTIDAGDTQGNGPWGIVVDDQDNPPLQVTGVKCNVYPVYLLTDIPASNELRIEFDVQPDMELDVSGLKFENAVPAGVFSDITRVSPDATPAVMDSTSGEKEVLMNPRLALLAGLTILALVLLTLGALILRSEASK